MAHEIMSSNIVDKLTIAKLNQDYLIVFPEELNDVTANISNHLKLILKTLDYEVEEDLEPTNFDPKLKKL